MAFDGLFDDALEAREIPAVAEWRPRMPPPLPSSVKKLIVDFETTGVKWWKGDRIVGAAVRVPEMVDAGLDATWYLPIRHAAQNLPAERVLEWLRNECRGRRIVNVRTSFDCQIALNDGVDWEALGCSLGDVAHNEALLDDHEFTFNLDHLAAKRGVEGKLRTVHGIKFDPSRMADYPAGLIAPYAMRDVEAVDGVEREQDPLLDALGLRRVQALEDEVIFAVCEMERNGVRLDVPLLEKWSRETKAAASRALYNVFRDCGVRVNPEATADWNKLFGVLRLEPPRDEKGAVSFADPLIANIAHPTVRMARAAKKLLSIDSKYFSKYLRSVGKGDILRYQLHQLRTDRGADGGGGTVSGRFSSSGLSRSQGEDEGANVQQVMQAKKQKAAMGFVQELLGLDTYFPVRQVFIPHEGETWLAADAKQIQYRIFAHYANSPALNQRYADDPETDFHNVVGEMVKKYRPDIIREHVKNVNFMLLFGGGDAKLGRMLGMETSEAKVLKRQYFKAFPEAETLSREATGLAERRGWVKTLLGRRSTFPGGEMAHKSLNCLAQGGEADIVKLVVVALHKERKALGLRPHFLVHDEFDGGLRDLAALDRVKEIFNTQYVPLRVKILWDVGTGDNWKEAK